MPLEETTYLEWWNIYCKLRNISEAYLKEEYDYIFYILRGGMTPVHILSHILRCKNSILWPLDIKRHINDDIRAQTIIPHLKGDIPQNIKNKNILIVEDTIGSGVTLSCALEAIEIYTPASIDIVSCGIDHKDLTTNAKSEAIETFINKVFIGFDYWGWLIFPWEEQAYNFLQAGNIYHNIPYLNMNSKNKKLEITLINGVLNKKLILSHELSITTEKVSNLLSKVIYTYDKPENIIVDLYLDINDLTLPIPQIADYFYALKGHLIDPSFLKTESVDLVIVRGVLASQIGLADWQAVAKQIHKCLKFNGRIIVNYLDRFKIQSPKDILLNMEYYTPYLMDRLMFKIGFKEDINHTFSERQVFYEGVKVKS